MNPKLYFDNSLIGDRDNELFCFLPFQDASEKRFEQILKPAALIYLQPSFSLVLAKNV